MFNAHMSTITAEKLLMLTLIVFPLLTFAQEGGEFTLGGLVVPYDTAETDGGTTYYYADGELVASDHGASAFLYENDQAILEAHDTDSDGSFDAFLTLDETSMVTEVTGDGAATFERREPAAFESVTGGASDASATDDLVGPLDRVIIPGGGGSYWWLIILILLGGAGYWWYRSKVTNP